VGRLAQLELIFPKFPIIFDLERRAASIYHYLEFLFRYHFLGSHHFSLGDNGKAVRASGNEVGNTGNSSSGKIGL